MVDKAKGWVFEGLPRLPRHGIEYTVRDCFVSWQKAVCPETGEQVEYLPVYDDDGKVIGRAWPSSHPDNKHTPGHPISFNITFNFQGWETENGTQQQPVRSMESSPGHDHIADGTDCG